MEDFCGNAVNLGDKVVMVETGYKNLEVRDVTKITPKGISINGTYKAPYQFVRYVENPVSIKEVERFLEDTKLLIQKRLNYSEDSFIAAEIIDDEFKDFKIMRDILD